MIEEIYSHWKESTGVCTDTRKITEGCIFFALKGANFDGNEFASQALDSGASWAVVDDPGVEGERMTLVQDVLTALQDVARHHREQLRIPVIGITGSNGKTTTKELVHAVLSSTFRTACTQGNFNNHIGVPLTLLTIREDDELAIVEMGANHQGEIAMLSEIARPSHGMITNVGKAHIEGFGGVEGVIKGKTELYRFLAKTEGAVFVNQQDPILWEKSEIINNRLPYLTSQGDGEVKDVSDGEMLTVSYGEDVIDTHLIGGYNLSNVAAALAIGDHFGVERRAAINAVEGYIPTNNRSEVKQVGEVKVVLDAYNANPSSMQVAVENFAKLKDRPKGVILGDMFELGEEAPHEHRDLIQKVKKAGFDFSIFVGKHFLEASTGLGVQAFGSFDDLEANIMEQDLSGSTLLIKGSRGMALERLVEKLGK